MSWTSPRFDGSRGYPPKGYFYNCNKNEPFYVRAGAWSPDDRTVYLASTGYRPWNANSLPARGLCDSASAFAATGSHPAMKWTNYTGCDSLFAVAADANAAYFGGHERWSQNPNGCDKPGLGAIDAPGMEAVNLATGHVLVNGKGTGLYTRGRGLGADDMLITTACGSPATTSPAARCAAACRTWQASASCPTGPSPARQGEPGEHWSSRLVC